MLKLLRDILIGNKKDCRVLCYECGNDSTGELNCKFCGSDMWITKTTNNENDYISRSEMERNSNLTNLDYCDYGLFNASFYKV